MLASAEVIKKSTVVFGTSGARGLACKLTANVCGAFTANFITVMRELFEFDRLAIGIDNRPSSYAMAQACAQICAQLNIRVIYYGVIPTPALAYSAMQDKTPAIMVTGSHIPFDRNGLKFYRPDGEITKHDELSIVTRNTLFEPVTCLPDLKTSKTAIERYILRYTCLFEENSSAKPDSLTLVGKRIGIYEHSSAGRDIYRQIFKQLGATVISLGRSNEFVPIDTEAVSADDKRRALDWVNEYQLDALFSTDGDGDRPLLADEQGEWLRGDILGLLCAKTLNIDALAVPINCNTAIELSGVFNHVIRTKIGSPYVIQALNDIENEEVSKGLNVLSLSEAHSVSSDLHCSQDMLESAVCNKKGVSQAHIAGFEANGGFLLGSTLHYNGKLLEALPTRDALLPALIVLADAISKRLPLSALVAALPKRYTSSDRLQNISALLSQQLLEDAKQNPQEFLKKFGTSIPQRTNTPMNEELNGKEFSNIKLNTLDGLRMYFNDKEYVHIRPSGNAPELRCYVEASSKQRAQDLLSTVIKSLKRTLSP
ncbi:phosphomannomutase [Pseudoalteromonas citrea]|uniref:Phosphomannomutase n=1 Tax=Pseudoalteromonas citrea TaxID=43655 RepID=A0A5S3XPE1_9GAMM|nr:phosphomannomutase [Pseudoalteromonas citrea]TMP45712.1 phosphomannomutase [Pseudoalteromonas citrea]TMP59091.1 phosphomannomutase [Pseudoalteromonas citrea]